MWAYLTCSANTLQLLAWIILLFLCCDQVNHIFAQAIVEHSQPRQFINLHKYVHVMPIIDQV